MLGASCSPCCTQDGCCGAKKYVLVLWIANSNDTPGLFWDVRFLGRSGTAFCGTVENDPPLITSYSHIPILNQFPPAQDGRITRQNFSVHHMFAYQMELWSESAVVDLHAGWWCPSGNCVIPCCGSGPVTFFANLFCSNNNNFLVGASLSPLPTQSITVTPTTYSVFENRCSVPKVGSVTVFTDCSFTMNNLP